MRRIRGAGFVSLDGVMQAPGGPDEDPTEGFPHGGWMFPFMDDAVGRTIDGLFAGPFELLLGRRTYDIFASYWPYAGDETAEIRDPFNRVAKHVLTRRDAPLAWHNSHPLPNVEALAALKATAGPDLIIQGSSTLYPQLLEAGLIDQLTLMIFPLVLGSGKRLISEGGSGSTWRLIAHEITSVGTIIATYEPAGPVRTATVPSPAPSAAELRRRCDMAEGRW